MEFKRPDELQTIADIHPAAPPSISRRERLDRWAALLEREPQRRVKTLDEIDLQPAAKRPDMRADDSPLTIAFADPVLRSEGLRSDKLGDAMRFFDISEHDVHWVLCSCLNGRTMEAGRAAQRIRMIAGRGRSFVRAGAVTALLGVPLLLYFF